MILSLSFFSFHFFVFCFFFSAIGNSAAQSTFDIHIENRKAMNYIRCFVVSFIFGFCTFSLPLWLWLLLVLEQRKWRIQRGGRGRGGGRQRKKGEPSQRICRIRAWIKRKRRRKKNTAQNQNEKLIWFVTVVSKYFQFVINSMWETNKQTHGHTYTLDRGFVALLQRPK